MGQRAAIYTRISKDSEGKALGVDRQRDDCVALAERLGYDSWEEFRDNDVSASTLSTKLRPRFKEMMDRARRGEFAAIIAYSNSRLTRRVVELQTLIDVTRTTGTRILTVASGQHDLDTADGRAAMMTIAVWDQAEAERVAERVARASGQRRSDGRWHGGVPPYGYRQEGKSLVIDDTEAEVVREAINRLVNLREPLYSIVKDWNTGPKYTTRKGKHWRHANLRALMTNRALLGENKAGVPAWEPITDLATFERLQTILVDPSRKKVHSPGVKGGKYAMGGGLTLCGKCGGALTSSARNQPDGSVIVKLKCSWLNNGKNERNHPAVARVRNGKEVMEDTGRVSVDHDALEEYVWDKFIEASESDDWNKRIAAKTPETEAKIRALEAERADLQDRLARAVRLSIEKPEHERLYVAEQDRIAGDLARVTTALNEQYDGQVATSLPSIPRDRITWRNWTIVQKRLMLGAYIDAVIVNGWPRDLPSATLSRKGETREQYETRRAELARQGLERRVLIVWKWGEVS